MGFVICAKDRDSGDTIVLGARWFASKDEAIASLSERDMLRDVPPGDLFLVDLDAATPVVIVPGLADDFMQAPAEATHALFSEDAPPADLREQIRLDVTEAVAAPSLFVLTTEEDATSAEVPDEQSELWWLEAGTEDDARSEHVSQLLAEVTDLSDAGAEEGAPEDEPPSDEDAPLPVAEAADDEFAPESDQAVPEAEAPAEPLEAPVFVRVDFEAWTCDDCVFVTTCDRVGVDRPATCASFQWRAG